MGDRTRCPAGDELIELALGELNGRGRADLLAHLRICPPCRDEVGGFAAVIDDVLVATAEAEPPPGFESAVLAAMAHSATPPRRLRRRTLMAAAAVVCLLAGVVGWALAGRGAPATAEAAMITASGYEVGTVVQYRSDSAHVVVVSVPGWSEWDDAGDPGRSYRVRAESGGRPVVLGEIDPGADTTWAISAGLPSASIDAVEIVDDTGHVWCRGVFAD